MRNRTGRVQCDVTEGEKQDAILSHQVKAGVLAVMAPRRFQCLASIFPRERCRREVDANWGVSSRCIHSRRHRTSVGAGVVLPLYTACRKSWHVVDEDRELSRLWSRVSPALVGLVAKKIKKKKVVVRYVLELEPFPFNSFPCLITVY